MSTSQGELLENFAQISAAQNLNHGDFNGGIQGKHKFLQMPEITDPLSPPSTTDNEGAVYTKENTGILGAVASLFFRDQSDGTERPLSNATLTTVSGTGFSGSFLITPWGIRILFGSGTTDLGATRIVSFGVLPLTAFNSTPKILLQTVNDNSTDLRASIVDTAVPATGTQMKVLTTKGSQAFDYFVIGT